MSKNKSIKGALKYETTPEDKKRRRAIKVGDRGQVFEKDNSGRFNRAVLADKLRQGYSVYKLGIRKVKENYMLIGVVGFLTGVWMSGFYAHAGNGFRSLLAFVCGVVVLSVFGTLGSKK